MQTAVAVQQQIRPVIQEQVFSVPDATAQMHYLTYAQYCQLCFQRGIPIPNVPMQAQNIQSQQPILIPPGVPNVVIPNVPQYVIPVARPNLAVMPALTGNISDRPKLIPSLRPRGQISEPPRLKFPEPPRLQLPASSIAPANVSFGVGSAIQKLDQSLNIADKSKSPNISMNCGNGKNLTEKEKPPEEIQSQTGISQDEACSSRTNTKVEDTLAIFAPEHNEADGMPLPLLLSRYSISWTESPLKPNLDLLIFKCFGIIRKLKELFNPLVLSWWSTIIQK